MVRKAIRAVVAIICAAFVGWAVITLMGAAHMPDVPGARVEVTQPHCADMRTTPFKVPGIEGAKAIAYQGGHLVALDGDGRLWSYFVEKAATCETQAGAVDPARAKMSSIASSTQALGLTSAGSLVTWEPFEWHRLCPPGFTGGACGAFLQHRFDGLRGAAGSSSHLVLVTGEGRVLSGGMNDCGQTGRPDHLSTSDPLSIAAVPDLTDIVAVASGKRSSMALARDGRVWTWGSLSDPLISAWSPPLPTVDAVYCRGDSDADEPPGTSTSTPVVVSRLPPVAAIASFHGFDLALDKQGRVWGWGYNDCGQLSAGDLPTDFQATPARIGGLPPISAIAAGARHSVFLGADGSVWAVGNNEFSQLAATTPTVSDGKTCQSSTQAVGVARHSEKPLRVQGFGPATAIAADSGHSAAIDTDGHVWIWGRYP
jgi:alpha-tubulin suppressor-like RCC1 family protein